MALVFFFSAITLPATSLNGATAPLYKESEADKATTFNQSSRVPANIAPASISGGQTRPTTVEEYCEQLARGKEEAAALQSVCEFALTLTRKLPSVIGDEERTRYQEDQMGGEVQRDLITAKVRYEDGQEEYTQVTINGKSADPAALGATGDWSEGEFATDLRTIFLPQSAAQLKFSKQEKLRGVQAAVFEFKIERKNNRLRFFQGPDGVKSFPGYHGRLWIDTANLRIVRLERKVDDVPADSPIQRADLLVDYSVVDLADGSKFVLPMHAMNTSCPTVASSHCWHNQLSFTHWHKFAARARVLTAAGEVPAPQPEASANPATASAIVAPVLFLDINRGTDIQSEVLKGEIASIEILTPKPVSPTALAAGNRPSAIAPVRQGLPSATNPATSQSQSPGEDIPVFKSSVRLVLVPTVVRDSQGRPVDHLQKTDFRLLDDRRPQEISQFALERLGRSASDSQEAVGMAPLQPSSLRNAAYVFDDIHASMDDLARARDAAQRHLKKLQPGERAAILTLSATVMLDFTNDAAKLNQALQLIRPHPLTAQGSVRCPDISYEQADLIQNNNDAIALEAATEDALKCAFGGDPSARISARQTAQAAAAQALIAGRAESQMSFKVLQEVVRGISNMPGQRSVVLISSGFPTAEMQQQLEAIIDGALKSEVVINVLDPSGLSTGDGLQYGTASGSSDVLADLAGGTGGAFFRNRNDMDEGFQKIALPELLYILGFSPRKLDGKLHKLKVTLPGSEKLVVQARRGYYASKPGD